MCAEETAVTGDADMPSNKTFEGTRSVAYNAKLQRLDQLASAMDTQWRLPLLNIRLGWDTILGLLPGIGDTISSLISVYILKEGHQLGVPFWVKAIMLWNIFIDWLIGLVPLVGDLFDVGWKANTRNVRLIQKHAKTD